MKKKIAQRNDFGDFSQKNLQHSINFWRFLLNNNYQIELVNKKNNNGFQEIDTFPSFSWIYDDSKATFEKITKKLTSSHIISPRLLLVDNGAMAKKIKNLLSLSEIKKKGVLPSIHLLSNFEYFQSNRPLSNDSKLIKSDNQRMLELVEKVPFLDSHTPNQSFSSFELASDWLRIIDRWEWLEECWKILGAPKIVDNDNDFELGQLDYLYLLKNALSDKSNAALWHGEQFQLATSNRCQNQQSSNTFSGVVMVLTELPDPLAIAKAIILARQKTCSWKIFLIKYPLILKEKRIPFQSDSWYWWEKNFPLIWPEAHYARTKVNKKNKIIDFESRRKKISFNSKQILRKGKNFSEFSPLRCIEVKNLSSMTEVAMTEIEKLINKKTLKIGIVALDRRATRRLIAKLTQKNIEVEDNAGWSLNTSVVSLSVINLVKIISEKISSDEFYYWISIPLVTRALVKNNFLTTETHAVLIQKLKNYKEEEEGVNKFIPDKLRDLLKKNKSKPLAEKLILILKESGLEEELLADSAGRVALKVCRNLVFDLIAKNISKNHFLSLIEWEFSKNNFSLQSSESTIKVISFQQAIWDPPNVIFVIGGTSKNMPSPNVSKFADSILWEKVSACPGIEEIEIYQLKIFITILKLKIPIILMGQAEEKKDFFRWSRWIERIRLMLPTEIKKEIFSKYETPRKTGKKQRINISYPSLYLKNYPYSLSVSNIKSLIECPYKFFWQSIFKLKIPHYFDDNQEYKEIGVGLHLLMECIGDFPSHTSDYRLKKLNQNDWLNFLITKLNNFINDGLITWEVALNIRARLRHLSEWCAGFFSNSVPLMIENKISGKLPGIPILVEGKVDRIEKKKDGNKKFLIDYKSSKITGPQNELQSSQILIYSWLLGAKNINISEAGYLCIDNKESKWLKIEKIDRGEEIIKKLCSTLLSLKEGYPIQPIASKSGFMCKSCSMRPVCRKDEWISAKKD